MTKERMWCRISFGSVRIGGSVVFEGLLVPIEDEVVMTWQRIILLKVPAPNPAVIMRRIWLQRTHRDCVCRFPNSWIQSDSTAKSASDDIDSPRSKFTGCIIPPTQSKPKVIRRNQHEKLLPMNTLIPILSPCPPRVWVKIYAFSHVKTTFKIGLNYHYYLISSIEICDCWTWKWKQCWCRGNINRQCVSARYVLPLTTAEVICFRARSSFAIHDVRVQFRMSEYCSIANASNRWL